jgi:hypothetical protein
MVGPHPQKETTLRRILAACRRLDDERIDAILGAAFVFALPFIVLAIGAVIDGGL